MHEASLCDALFDQVDASIAPHRGATVRRVHVAIGALAGVDPELFAIAFGALREARHPHAELALTHVEARWQCLNCEDIHRPGAPLTCPHCKLPLDLTAGGDMTLMRIELELPPEPENDHV
jgi:Zn finger protein HypA/HybF involved in hydrogenase expression